MVCSIASLSGEDVARGSRRNIAFGRTNIEADGRVRSGDLKEVFLRTPLSMENNNESV
jgi:hypothetical protein